MKITTQQGRGWVCIASILAMWIFIVIDQAPANGVYVAEMVGTGLATAVATAILLAFISE